jgi:hypothetical protein
MKFKVGDTVKFTETCVFDVFHEMGTVGKIERIVEGVPFPYEVVLEEGSYDTLVRHQKIAKNVDRFEWFCVESELELV